MRMFLLILLASCSSSIFMHQQGIPIHMCGPEMVGVSNDLSDDEIMIVAEAVRFWNDQSSRPVFVWIGSTDKVPAIDGTATQGFVIVGYPLDRSILASPLCINAQDNATTHWVADQSTGCIHTASVALMVELRVLDHDTALAVVKHELGHVLGLGHANGPDHVMSAVIPCEKAPIATLTLEEATEFRSYYFPGK